MKKSLSKTNRVALVTGGGHGLGKEIAISLAKEGMDVVICGRNGKKLRDASREIEKLGGCVYQYCLDATDYAQVENLFEEVIRKVGRLDILVNTIGGVTKFGNFDELTPRDWKESLDLNLLTAVYFCQEAIPWLRKSGAARIVNISTIPAHQPGQFNPHYSAAKAGLLNLSKYLANFLAKDKILVNAVCPGTLFGGSWDQKVRGKATRFHLSIKKAEELLRQEEEAKVPLGRICQLTDVANLVAFLASDKASFITGACINIDGGVVKSML